MDKDLPVAFDKVAYARELIAEEEKQIVVLEIRIKARRMAIEKYPDTPDGKLQTERAEAELDQFTDKIAGKKQTILTIYELIKEYQTVQHE